MDSSYESPDLEDYGSLTDVTEASGLTGAEDGGSKLLIHHSGPSVP